MNRNEAGKQVCKITLYAVIMLELIWLVAETRGDFANGILFYIQAQLNPLVLSFFALLFGSSYFLGKRALGEIESGNAYVKVGVIHGLLGSAILLIYLFIISLTMGQLSTMLHYLPQLSLMIILPMLLIWFIATNTLRQKIN
jgi:hypothetical protein